MKYRRWKWKNRISYDNVLKGFHISCFPLTQRYSVHHIRLCFVESHALIAMLLTGIYAIQGLYARAHKTHS